jgi:lipoprotein-anchoring transpeptidase ErfK/SrfK
MHLLSEKVYALDLMSCRARGPTLGAAMALLIALVLGGCMQATLNPVWDANFTARDKQQLANPPYQQAWIPPAYQRQVVQYHRKDAPGSILVDTDGRYVYYVLPEGRGIRYGAIVGENGQAWSGVATVGRTGWWLTRTSPTTSSLPPATTCVRSSLSALAIRCQTPLNC